MRKLIIVQTTVFLLHSLPVAQSDYSCSQVRTIPAAPKMGPLIQGMQKHTLP